MIQTVGKVQRTASGILISSERPEGALLDEVTITWHPAGQITPQQRSKARALVSEISTYCGYLSSADKDLLHGQLKALFVEHEQDKGCCVSDFSLADADQATAGHYIDWLVQIALELGVATKEPMWQLSDDTEAYVRRCAMLGICAVCHKHAGIHHVDKIGMGRSRRHIVHVGLRGLPLCWGVHGHHWEIEHIGNEAFLEKYHLPAIVIDEAIARVYRLRQAAEGGVPDAAEDPPEGADLP